MTRARRNSPAVAHLGPQAQSVLTSEAGSGRDLRALLPKMPAPPRQGEMSGMETDDAAVLLKSVERQQQQKRAKSNSKEDLFDFQLRSYELPRFERQYPFAESMGRKWRLDFANLQFKLAIEIEGLVVQRLAGELVVRGRHASIQGFKEDAVKYATAVQLGWRVVRFEQSQVKDGTAIDLTQRILVGLGWEP